ncbi:isocitrate dehydrogenase [NAD] regulatory subunit 3, mitochondrial-like [Benincasa hispida]|uniref:isocitrate dehydrogenase [NAD] regulatory subunit 3, mitochondrial-like n=1 Tax=Benincasa hispida TaxID=102211 RepID=UPI0019006E0B|nr:isocitrate dehydrogenase [NAD] regulatory subunit 3, mitochondrial-like [Benincasa hispida]
MVPGILLEGQYSNLRQTRGAVGGWGEVTPNLYGNLVANTAAGIAGGTGVMPGGNVVLIMLFLSRSFSRKCGNERLGGTKEGKPCGAALIICHDARHLQFPSFADRLETAVKKVIFEGKYRTKDLGGQSTTQEVVDAVIAALD